MMQAWFLKTVLLGACRLAETVAAAVLLKPSEDRAPTSDTCPVQAAKLRGLTLSACTQLSFSRQLMSKAEKRPLSPQSPEPLSVCMYQTIRGDSQ